MSLLSNIPLSAKLRQFPLALDQRTHGADDPSLNRRAFLQQRRPVDDHRQRLRGLLLRRGPHQEALAVRRYIVGASRPLS
jgi:hypothetical protein